MRGRRLAALLLVVAALAAAALIARPYVHGLSFVVRVADMKGALRRAADMDAGRVRETEITLPLSRGPLRARVYTPGGARHRTTLLVSGLHPSGIDEPRLVRLARNLSASGVTVVTPDIPELSRFEITPAITDDIEQAAGWLASNADLTPERTVGMMGISFSGGLSAIAAGRPSLAGRVAYVFSFGGHHDLPRVLRYLCTGTEPYPSGQVRLMPPLDRPRGGPERAEGPDTTGPAATEAKPDQPFVRPPHDYGVAVILLGAADRLVPRAQVDPLRDAVHRFLLASALDTVDKPKADVEFAALRELAKRLPEPSATLLRYVNDRDVVHLGPRLLPLVATYGGDPALSLSRSPKPNVPVFLLHGIEDNVIPPLESEYLANDLRGHAPVRLLLSGLISHAEADQPPRVGDVMQLAGFWGDLLQR